MHVYSKDRLLHRLSLNEVDGFWIDYWLFLHSDETHAVWGARPIGLPSIARMAENLDPRIDIALTRAIITELDTYRLLRPYMDNPCPHSHVGSFDDKQLCVAEDWLSWLCTFKEEAPHRALVSNMFKCVEQARGASDLGVLSFLSRRISSELSEYVASCKPLFYSALTSLERRSVGALSGELANLTKRAAATEFLVRFGVSGVAISRRVEKSFGGERIKLVCAENDGQSADPNHHKSRLLVGIEVAVTATEPHHALQLALCACRQVLERLRITHYIRTHLTGAAAVEGGCWNTHLALDQPFWTSKPGRRKVPRLPSLSQLESLDGGRLDNDPRWNAMRWHVSQAIAVWSEDIHNAASHVWQAIEVFSHGNGTARVRGVAVANEYLGAAPLELVEYAAIKLSAQASINFQMSSSCDWFVWDSAKETVAQWYKKITNRYDTRHFSKWTCPPAPRIVFDRQVGLLKASGYQLAHPCRAPEWLHRRLNLDLDHLYALRNTIIHKGERSGSDPWAAYLARLGLEVLFTIAAHRSRPRSRRALL